jgi:malate-CoA ligase subunit beta
MDIHEHQAKDILADIRRAGAERRPRLLARTGGLPGAELGFPCVVKAQIHSGGRGEAGGVKVCRSEAEVRDYAADLLGKTLVTKQTGAQRQAGHRLWVEEATDIAQEIYLGFVLDRKSERIMIVASGHGGMEIEDLAARGPRQPRADGRRPRHRARGVPGARARLPPRASGKQIGQMVTTLAPVTAPTATSTR